jgi:hypothetical protein
VEPVPALSALGDGQAQGGGVGNAKPGHWPNAQSLPYRLQKHEQGLFKRVVAAGCAAVPSGAVHPRAHSVRVAGTAHVSRSRSPLVIKKFKPQQPVPGRVRGARCVCAGGGNANGVMQMAEGEGALKKAAWYRALA